MKDINVIHIEGKPVSSAFNDDVARMEAHRLSNAGVNSSVTKVSVLDPQDNGKNIIDSISELISKNTEAVICLIIFLFLTIVICI